MSDYRHSNDIAQFIDGAMKLMRNNDYEGMSFTLISGINDELPYCRVRIVDKSGKSDAWALDWVG